MALGLENCPADSLPIGALQIRDSTLQCDCCVKRHPALFQPPQNLGSPAEPSLWPRVGDCCNRSAAFCRNGRQRLVVFGRVPSGEPKQSSGAA